MTYQQSKTRTRTKTVSHININNIDISTKKYNKKVPITLNDKPLLFQTYWMDVKTPLTATTFPDIFILETLMVGDTANRNSLFEQFIDNYEMFLCHHIEKHGSEWFAGKNVMIKSLIRKPEAQNSYFSWPIYLQSSIFIDEAGNSFDPYRIKEKDSIKLIVECPHLWISDDRFGSNVIVHKVMVRPLIEPVDVEYVFASDSDSGAGESEDDHIVSLLATEKPPTKATVTKTKLVPSVTKTSPQPIKTQPQLIQCSITKTHSSMMKTPAKTPVHAPLTKLSAGSSSLVRIQNKQMVPEHNAVAETVEPGNLEENISIDSTSENDDF